MNELRIFEKQEFGQIRVIDLNGEPHFVLKDVCIILGLNDAHKVADRLDEDERNQIPVTDSLGRNQDTTVVNESGLYSVILRSDKPQAKQFKKWVTADVLPSIHKTGSYLAGGNENLSPQNGELIIMATRLTIF